MEFEHDEVRTRWNSPDRIRTMEVARGNRVRRRPGGPIKIILIPAVAFCFHVETPPVVCSSLDSNCSTRVSSLRTKSRRASKEASSIGAIAKYKDYQKAGPRQEERSEGAKPYGQRLIKIISVLVGKRYMWTFSSNLGHSDGVKSVS